jgi:NhaA family Na+:H+ antiporter
VLVLAAAVGFTMALFIANPAFVPDGNESAKLGILFASLFCAAAGMAMLRWMSGRRERA